MTSPEDFANQLISKVQADLQYRTEVRTARIVAVNGDGTYHATMQGQNIPMQNIPAPPNANFAVGDVVTLGFSNQDKNRPEIISWRTEQPTTNPPVFDLAPKLGNVFDMDAFIASSSNVGREVTTGNSTTSFSSSIALSGGAATEEFFCINGGLIYTIDTTAGKLNQYTMGLNQAGTAYVLNQNWSVTFSVGAISVAWVTATNLYVFTASSSVNLINVSAKTGATIWTTTLPNFTTGLNRPAAVMLGNSLIAMSIYASANQILYYSVDSSSGALTQSSYTFSGLGPHPSIGPSPIYRTPVGLYQFYVWVDNVTGHGQITPPGYLVNCGAIHVTTAVAGPTGLQVNDNVLPIPGGASNGFLGGALFQPATQLSVSTLENESHQGLFTIIGTLAVNPAVQNKTEGYSQGFYFTGNSIPVQDALTTTVLNTGFTVSPAVNTGAYAETIGVGKSNIFSISGSHVTAWKMDGITQVWQVGLPSGGAQGFDWITQDYIALPNSVGTKVNLLSTSTGQMIASLSVPSHISFTNYSFVTQTGIIVVGTPNNAAVYGLVTKK